MGRKDRKTISSGNNGTPKWTDEQRQALRLCYKLWNLTDQEVNALMHRCYPEFRETAGRNYTYDHTRDEYKHRFSKRRSKRWHAIDRPNKFNSTRYTQEEIDELYRVQVMVEDAASAGPDQDAMQLTPRENAPFPLTYPNGIASAPVDKGVKTADASVEDATGEQDEDEDKYPEEFFAFDITQHLDDEDDAAGAEADAKEKDEEEDTPTATAPTRCSARLRGKAWRLRGSVCSSESKISSRTVPSRWAGASAQQANA
ncbi:hypothetical protein M409DRAFT_29580 [Zasmidium cellare ATCC 36951]|uniref:Uncharacterized protein n=1 Tax=Zasmidium cellare ATCC 36951 TaxID=1080233 RepID=A0A6A6C1D9_ZASCE|nr:uncharacterized protein M409DRAFT_29580 [Zasmidium cellare ATCC 36951]KAF2159970.1 hypothetical protein M409DRAFT_29580 [Zasmidium cellare ATCC 36951]